MQRKSRELQPALPPPEAGSGGTLRELPLQMTPYSPNLRLSREPGLFTDSEAGQDSSVGVPRQGWTLPLVPSRLVMELGAEAGPGRLAVRQVPFMVGFFWWWGGTSFIPNSPELTAST